MSKYRATLYDPWKAKDIIEAFDSYEAADKWVSDLSWDLGIQMVERNLDDAKEHLAIHESTKFYDQALIEEKVAADVPAEETNDIQNN